jgi:NitT/TauT family transport system substrate-binding protein
MKVVAMTHTADERVSGRSLGRVFGAATPLAALLLATGLLAGCGSSKAAGGAATESITVVVPTSSVAAEYGIFAAQDQGYFAAEHLNVKVTSVAGGAEAVQALATGVADLVDAPTSTVFGAIAKQAALKPTYVCRTHWIASTAVYVPTASTVQGGADLKGAVIGVDNPAGPAANAAKALASSGGLSPADYKIIQVGSGGEALAAFQRKDITAYAGGVSDVAVAQTKGFGVRQLPNPPSVDQGQGFWASTKAFASKSDAISKFLTAYEKGINYIGNDSDKLVSLMAKVAPAQATDKAVADNVATAFIDARSHELPATDKTCEVADADLSSWYGLVNKSGQFTGTQADFSAFFTNKYADAS